MNRRFGMWIALICILVVGVSVTKMTSDFVSSNGVEAAAIVNVMDSSVSLTSGLSVVKEVFDEEPAAVTEETAAFDEVEEAVAEETAPETDDTIHQAMAVAEAAPASEDLVMFEAFDPEQSEEEMFEDGAAEMGGLSEAPMAGAGSVKSPLDPEPESEGPYVEDKYGKNELSSEYFYDRFAAAEAGSLALWDMVTPDHAGAYYNAAEQEHVLWDHELNHIYSTILERLTDTEAEQLRALELEWMKERDLYANKTMSASKNKAMQSSDYLQALTLMTKERCYWLVEEYGTVLDSKE